jgi:hypothetical protein
MRIGYLGVGNMGQPMAGKLLDAGTSSGSMMSARTPCARFSNVRRVRRPHQRSWLTHATRSLSPCRRLRFFDVRFPDPTACSRNVDRDQLDGVRHAWSSDLAGSLGCAASGMRFSTAFKRAMCCALRSIGRTVDGKIKAHQSRSPRPLRVKNGSVGASK